MSDIESVDSPHEAEDSSPESVEVVQAVGMSDVDADDSRYGACRCRPGVLA